MLGFTHESKQFKAVMNEFDFQPIIISNKPNSKKTKDPSQKVIANIHPLSRNKKRINGIQQHSERDKPQSPKSRHEWKDGGKIVVFDGQIKKNQLAAEERRLQANSKKQSHKANMQRELAYNQKQIDIKTLKLQKQQQEEINRLKKLIEKDRAQKEKNQRQYEIKFKHMQQQKKELIALQRKILEKGVKKQKEYTREMHVLAQIQHPVNDKNINRQDSTLVHPAGRMEELTQSEANQQRNELRQRQLQLLTQQRQKCIQNTSVINCNPMMIPLLSRASYKIVSTHISTLVELFIDDLLQQQVHLLQAIQLQESMEKEKQRERGIINDYYQQLDGFVNEAEEIEARVGRYNTMRFEDLYIPKNYGNEKQISPKYAYLQNKQCLLTGLQAEVIEQIEDKRDRFIRIVSNFDDYKKANLTMFTSLTEQIINEAVQKFAKQLDKGSGDFVEVIFRKQFE